MADTQQFELNPDHALAAFWVTWEALGRAVAEVASLTGDEAAVRKLRADMLAPFLGQISETEAGAGVMHPAFLRHLPNFDPEAIQTGIRAVDAAIARTHFGK